VLNEKSNSIISQPVKPKHFRVTQERTADREAGLTERPNLVAPMGLRAAP